MELYQLRQFAAVAKYENMTRAAESLNVAQPGLYPKPYESGKRAGSRVIRANGKGIAPHRARYPAAVRTDDTGSRARRTRRNRGEPAPDRRSVHLCAVVRGAYQRDTRGVFRRVRQSGSAHQQHARGQRPAARFRGIATRRAVRVVQQTMRAEQPEGHQIHRESVSLTELADDPFIALSNSQSFRQISEHIFRSAG